MSVEASIEILRALLSPVSLESFFDRHYEKQPLHVAAERASPIALDEVMIRDAIHALDELPGEILVFPEHFLDGELTAHALLQDRWELAAYLEQGHALVWNRARGVFPAVDALADALSEAFGAKVWPNVYATGTAGVPFGMHFDCHEVLAVHCEGTKTWRISEVRVDRPIDAVEMEEVVSATIRSRAAEAADRIALTATVAPGDVIYVPRGQFHDASTPTGRSLHVTFGVRLLEGFDVMKLLMAAALADPRLREYVPPRAADPTGERGANHVRKVLERIKELAGDELFEAAMDVRARMNAPKDR